MPVIGKRKNNKDILKKKNINKLPFWKLRICIPLLCDVVSDTASIIVIVSMKDVGTSIRILPPRNLSGRTEIKQDKPELI